MDLEDRGLNGSNMVATLSGLCAVILSKSPHLDVIAGADVRQLIALEAEKQAIGCSDNSSCLAEVADAMGAKIVVFGQVVKLGSLLLLTLNVYGSKKARSMGRTRVQSRTLAELPQKLRPAPRATAHCQDESRR